MIKKRLLLIMSFYALVLGGVYAWQWYQRLHPAHSTGQDVCLQLQRGPFTVYQFKPHPADKVLAIVLFGSGDGGWSGWEDTVSHALTRSGYEVIGIDSAAYAQTKYNLPILQADFRKIAQAAEAPFGHHPPPLVVGGWSMGAGQAIAVAGGPNPPPGLVGVVLVSPLSRGRYGLTLTDKLNVIPTGPGTFAVKDFSHHLNELRVVQWHGSEDWIDSRAWLKDLTASHREYDLPHAGHTYAGASAQFQQEFVASVDWILSPDSTNKLAGDK